MRPVGGSRGFTLVEVVVSLAVLSLIMLATVTGLRTLGRTQVTVDRQVDRVSELRVVSGFLRDSFRTAVMGSNTGGLSLGGGGGGGSGRTVFEAVGRDEVIWKSVLLFGEAFGGTYLLRLGRDGDKLVLRWREQGNIPVRQGWNNAPKRTLVSGVDSFEIAYRGLPGDTWRRDWRGEAPPGWLRLRLQVGGRYWPDLVMAVAR